VQLPSGPTDFRTTVVKPYFVDLEVQNEPEPNEESANDLANKHGQPHRNAEQTRRLPVRFRQQLADILVLLQGDTVQPSYKDSRRKELNGLFEKGVFETVDISTVPLGARIFNSQFVDEIKNPGTDKAFEKLRLVVQAYNDQGKDLVLTQSPTIQRISQRIILALSAILQNESTSLYLRDISQAYVQSDTRLNRDFYVRPPAELQLNKGTILKVVKPLYGVPEVGNHWFSTYH
jgi:hypothetical protein